MSGYVPIQATNSEAVENVSISMSSTNLKLLIGLIVAGVVLYFVYQQLNKDSSESKRRYETRSEKMIAEARGRVHDKNEEELLNEDFSDLSDLSDISNLTADMEKFEKNEINKRKNKKNKKNNKNKNKNKKKLKSDSDDSEDSDDTNDFFEPLSEENYNESDAKQNVEGGGEDREPYVEQQPVQQEQEQMMNNMQPGGRMGPGMMGMDMGSNQLAGIPEE